MRGVWARTSFDTGISDSDHAPIPVTVAHPNRTLTRTTVPSHRGLASAHEHLFHQRLSPLDRADELVHQLHLWGKGVGVKVGLGVGKS